MNTWKKVRIPTARQDKYCWQHFKIPRRDHCGYDTPHGEMWWVLRVTVMTTALVCGVHVTYTEMSRCGTITMHQLKTVCLPKWRQEQDILQNANVTSNTKSQSLERGDSTQKFLHLSINWWQSSALAEGTKVLQTMPFTVLSQEHSGQEGRRSNTKLGTGTCCQIHSCKLSPRHLDSTLWDYLFSPYFCICLFKEKKKWNLKENTDI